MYFQQMLTNFSPPPFFFYLQEEIESLQAKWRQQGQFLSLFQFKSTGFVFIYFYFHFLFFIFWFSNQEQISSPSHSTGAAIPDGNQRLSLYIVDKAKFPSTISPTETSFEKIASPTFSNWRRQGVVDRMELVSFYHYI